MKRIPIFFLTIISTLAINGAKTTPQKKDAKDALEINTMQEFREVLSERQPALIMFYAPWCGACKSMKEPLHKLAEKYKGKVRIVKINTDNEKLKEAADSFGVEAIPTIFIKNVGATDEKTLEAILKQLVPETPKKEIKPKPTKQPSKKAPKKAAPSKKQPAPKRPKIGPFA